MQIVCPRILNRLDYCNSLLAGTTLEQMSRIQRVQNSAAKLIPEKKHRCYATPLLKNDTGFQSNEEQISKWQHWLTDTPTTLYLLKCQPGLLAYTPSRSLRSCPAQLLSSPRVNLKTAGERSFGFQAPRVWNSFPVEIRQSTSLLSLENNPETYLFIQAFKN